jgi:hypothetical protein
MIGLSALIILLLSLAGILVMVFRKIPQLLELPEAGPFIFGWRNISKRAKELKLFRGFSFEMLLQRILSKVRVLTLRTEHTTSNLLQKMREDSQRKKFEENDNYWKEIKKMTKKRNSGLPR